MYFYVIGWRGRESLNHKGDTKSPQSSSNYTMATAVRLTGVEPYRIRRYEKDNLLVLERTNGNQRLLSDKDIEIIKQAAKLEDEGINTAGIKVILAIRRGDRK